MKLPKGSNGKMVAHLWSWLFLLQCISVGLLGGIFRKVVAPWGWYRESSNAVIDTAEMRSASSHPAVA